MRVIGLIALAGCVQETRVDEIAPSFVVAPDLADLGSAPVGVATPFSLSLVHTGGGALHLGAVVVEAVDGDGFAFVGDAPLSVAPAGAVDLPFVFAPTAPAWAFATITLLSDATTPEVVLQARARAVAGWAAARPGRVDFGAVAAGGLGEADVRVTNAGTTPILLLGAPGCRMNGWQQFFRKTIQLTSTSTSDVFVDLSEWFASIGVDNAQATLKLSGGSGPQVVRAKLAVQAAPVRTDKAGQWAAYDSYQTGDGERATAVVNLATQLDATQSFRFGLAYSLSSAGIGSCTAELVVTWAPIGSVVDSRSLRVVTDSASPLVEAVTGWFPAANIGKLDLSIVASACDSGLEWRPVWQSTSTSPELASATWTALVAAYTAGPLEVNTGLQAIATTDFWVRAGLQAKATVGGTLVQGSFAVTTNARKT